MSTVKSKKLQVGTDATSSNNFTIYQPATPDGTLRIGVGNADSPTEVGRFTSNGLSVTGRVQSTTQPAFTAYKTSSQTNGGVSGGNDVVTYDATFVDTTSSFDIANNKYVVPVTGIYFIGFNLTGSSASISNRYFRGKLQVNGVTKFASHTHISNETSDNDYYSCGSSSVLSLSSGDEIQLVWGAGTASTINLYTAEANNVLYGYLIG